MSATTVDRVIECDQCDAKVRTARPYRFPHVRSRSRQSASLRPVERARSRIRCRVCVCTSGRTSGCLHRPMIDPIRSSGPGVKVSIYSCADAGLWILPHREVISSVCPNGSQPVRRCWFHQRHGLSDERYVALVALVSGIPEKDVTRKYHNLDLARDLSVVVVAVEYLLDFLHGISRRRSSSRAKVLLRAKKSPRGIIRARGRSVRRIPSFG